MIEKSQWFSPEEMREHQRRLVVEFVRYAVRDAPYYRDVFKRIGIAPEDVHDIDDLSACQCSTRKQFETIPIGWSHHLSEG